MSEDSGRLSRKEKEELLAKLMEKQITAAAWNCVNRIGDDRFGANISELISALTETAWKTINNPTLDKNRSPEGFVMQRVKWKATQLGQEFCDRRHEENMVKHHLKNKLDSEDEPQEDPPNYREKEICDQLRNVGTKEEAVRLCISKGFRTPAHIKTIFQRCELDSVGLDALVAENIGERVPQKPGVYSIVRELVQSGVTEADAITRHLDCLGVAYKPSIVYDYRRKFLKEMKCQK